MAVAVAARGDTGAEHNKGMSHGNMVAREEEEEEVMASTRVARGPWRLRPHDNSATWQKLEDARRFGRVMALAGSCAPPQQPSRVACYPPPPPSFRSHAHLPSPRRGVCGWRRARWWRGTTRVESD